ncbi:sulfotransferase family protein [Candidatus Leptofilum sp.]|uniref:sulfotransferase family protein n=1 Tax=Candidatus Leptofilum sp. TaxID=3241576 RepID=UPI003B5A116A
MTLKVIGSGFGRTGTLSLKAALEILGFAPCYHMKEVIKRPSHIKLWQQIAHNQPVPWNDIFTNFQAVVDFPASIFYQELLEAYQTAKVIHTVRDPERWYDSTAETIYRAAESFSPWMAKMLPPLGNFIDMQERIIWQRLFNGRFSDRPYAIQQFNAHTEAVKQNVPPEKLLIFQVKEGWEPLCKFLGVPVPDLPFPHVNDRENMLRDFKRLRQTFSLLPLAIAALGFFLLWQRSKLSRSVRKLGQNKPTSVVISNDSEKSQARHANILSD